MGIPDDRELIGAVRAGDREAFAVLLQRYHGSVYRLCRRMTDNVPDAEDLCHQAFVEAYLKLGQLRDPERFGGWLRTLVLNLCRMWHRRRRRERTLAAQAAGEPQAPVADARDDRRLPGGMARLSAPQRLLLVLHYMEGLSYKELAAFLDVPVGTVMSRLHRARAALRDTMNNMTEDYDHETDTPSTEDFSLEVDAEIALVLKMSGEQPGSAKRLAVLLQRSPERLTQLLLKADRAALESLARLLPRLGAPGLQVLLKEVASGDTTIHAQASATIERSVALLNPRGPQGSSSGYMPPRYAYVLLDEILGASLDTSLQVELLEGLALQSRDDATAALFVNALLCFPDEAFARLWLRFESARDPEELFRTPDVLYGLCRTGERFIQALVDLLTSDDSRWLRLALAGAEGVARCMDPGWLLGASEDRRLNERRSRRKWPPLRRESLPGSLLAALEDRVAGLLSRDEAPVREAALRVLGLLTASRHIDAVRACARHPEASTRMAALLALGEMKDMRAAGLMIAACESVDAAERRTAVEALARLRAPGTGETIARRVDDPDGSVRKAAVNALGDFDEGRETLQRLIKGADKAMARAAAESLYREARPERKELDVSRRRKEMAGMAAEPFTYISIDAALRFAMPELRAYDHRELTERLARVNSDYSSTRRYLVEEGLLRRDGDRYEPTDLGAAAWRVERRILQALRTAE